jgi:hypothetical protein
MSHWVKVSDSGLHRLCNVLGYKLSHGFKRSALIPTFLQRKPFDKKVERLFLCGDLEPAESGSNECAVSCNLRLESFFDC